MKKYKTLLFYLLIPLICSSQGLVKEGKIWSNTQVGSEFGSSFSSHYIKFDGDTLINEHNYKYVLRSDNEAHDTWYGHGFIREDTVSKKVFFFNTANCCEELLYDFSLNLGDSIYSSNVGRYLKADSVIFAPFGNSTKTLKQILLSSHGEKTKWIEDVGSMNGVLNGLPSFGLVGGYSYLVCYLNNDTLIYHNPAFNNCFHEGTYNSVNEQHQKIKSLQINYDKGQIHFSLYNDNNYRDNILQITDLSGKKILDKKLAPNGYFTISRETIKPGIYFYLFISGGLTESGKVVIK
jgi:hypothetical protein